MRISRGLRAGGLVLAALLVVAAIAACICAPPVASPQQLAQVAAELARGGATAIHTDPSLADLRRSAELRELLRSNARAEPLCIAADDEPGQRLRVRARVVRAGSGEPVPAAQVYLYHTRDSGVYGTCLLDGSELPKLFGFVLTDARGGFEIESIVPGHYPFSRHPRHVHYEITPPGEPLHGREFLFADDPFLDARERDRARDHGWPIATPTLDERGTVVCELDLPIP